MKSMRTWSHRRLFWVGLTVIILIVGGRIAWVMYTRRSPYYFAKRKTNFRLLGKPYQPKWEPVYHVPHQLNKRPKKRVEIASEEGLHDWGMNVPQTLLEDSISPPFGRHALHMETIISYGTFTVTYPDGHNDHECEIEFRCDDKSRGSGDIHAEPVYERETGILTGPRCDLASCALACNRRMVRSRCMIAGYSVVAGRLRNLGLFGAGSTAT